MYLENKTNLEIEMSQTSAQGHQGRGSLRAPEAVAGNFGELRLLQGISERGDTQKVQQSAVLPSGQCVIHTEGFVPVRQEDRYDNILQPSLLLHGCKGMVLLSKLTTATPIMPLRSHFVAPCHTLICSYY